MQQARELARLNLVLEMVSECAALVDADGARRLVADRLRWILDFERCELALASGGALELSALERGADSLAALPGGWELSRGRELIEAALSTGAPAASGRPISSAAYPLGSPDAPLGALFVDVGAGSLSQRDLRLLQHVCSSLGAVLERVEGGRIAAAHLARAAEQEERGRRERAALDEAVAANAAKDEFLAMLGHELRNPLAPILSSAALLRGEVSGRPALRVDVIERQALHLDRLVADLLDASRIGSGKVTLRRAPTDMREVASKSAEMARPGIEAKQQSLELRLPSEPAPVDGDEARLAQVLSNLLNNACLYSPPGARVSLAVERVGGEILATVEDDGAGMSPQTLSRAFEMFVQGARSHELAPGGLGLGLGVARALVEVHGGRIDAHSAGEGLGSRFRVWLPALDASAPAAPAPAPAQAPEAGGPMRVLLVDDNADAGDSMAEILRALGHEVLVAYSPSEALAAAPAFAPQAAVLDIGLPQMDGHRLAVALRELLPRAPRMIALSGYGQERDKEKSAQLGFHAHLVKPADIGALASALAPASISPL